MGYIQAGKRVSLKVSDKRCQRQRRNADVCWPRVPDDGTGNCENRGSNSAVKIIL